MADLTRRRCPACGEEVVGQDAEAVERIAGLHRCPPPSTPDPIVMALSGRFDG